MNNNTKLAIAALILGALSVWTWNDSLSRGDRFTRGQKLLQNLNPDEIKQIQISEGEVTATLMRQGDGFVVREHYDYPAANESINRFIRDLLEITLEKEVGVGPELQADLGIEPKTADTAEVVLINSADEEMVRLRFGREAEEANGRYVLRLDQDDPVIHMTTEAAPLNADPGSFLDDQILDISSGRIRQIDGPDYLLAPDSDDELVVVGPPAGRKTKKSAVNRVSSILSNFTFEKVLLADDPEVFDLIFEPTLTVELDDQTGYILKTATAEGRTYLQIEGFHQIGQVEITLETPEEELKGKADQLTRADEIVEFNDFHSSWVYELSSAAADKLALRSADLLEDS